MRWLRTMGLLALALSTACTHTASREVASLPSVPDQTSALQRLEKSVDSPDRVMVLTSKDGTPLCVSSITTAALGGRLPNCTPEQEQVVHQLNDMPRNVQTAALPGVIVGIGVYALFCTPINSLTEGSGQMLSNVGLLVGLFCFPNYMATQTLYGIVYSIGHSRFEDDGTRAEDEVAASYPQIERLVSQKRFAKSIIGYDPDLSGPSTGQRRAQLKFPRLSLRHFGESRLSYFSGDMETAKNICHLLFRGKVDGTPIFSTLFKKYDLDASLSESSLEAVIREKSPLIHQEGTYIAHMPNFGNFRQGLLEKFLVTSTHLNKVVIDELVCIR